MKKQIKNAVNTAKENAKSVNAAVNSGRKELSNLFTSAFVGINLFNKIVDGRAFVPDGITVDGIKTVSKSLKAIHGQSKGFSADVLPRDRYGRICTTEKSKFMPSWENDLIDIKCGKYVYLRPVSEGCTFTRLYNEFGRIVKEHAAAAVADAKADAKAAKEAAELRKMRAVVADVFGEYAKHFSEAEIREKYAKIKAA